MAANLLPLALLGAGAAIVVSREKKKREKAEECPSVVKIDAASLVSIDKRATAKHGNDRVPAAQANFALNEMLPDSCKRSSVNSKARVVFSADNQIDVDIPKLYMLLYMSLLGSRVNDKVNASLGIDEAMKMWARELDWYKSVTGSDFNPNDPQYVALAKGFGEAMSDALENLLPGKKEKPQTMCPPNVDLHVDGLSLAHATELTQAMIDGGTTNPFELTSAYFEVVMPSSCKRTSHTSNVRMYAQGKLVMVMDVALFYGNMVLQFAGDLTQMDKITNTDYLSVKGLVEYEYETLTGKKFKYVDL